jgi:hypothetical protein
MTMLAEERKLLYLHGGLAGLDGHFSGWKCAVAGLIGGIPD